MSRLVVSDFHGGAIEALADARIAGVMKPRSGQAW
jgi:hypothetical protein